MSTDVIGHSRVTSQLIGSGVPAVSLFEGPSSVGKTTTALWLRKNILRVPDEDFIHVKHLTHDSARAVADFLRRTPIGGRGRLAIVYVGDSGWTAQSILLGALESLTGMGTHTILIAPPDAVSPPLRSRAWVFRFGLLKNEDVAQILMNRGFHENSAHQLAELAGGRVQPALDSLEANEAKAQVISAVRVLQNRDAKALSSFAARWSDNHTTLLKALCYEALTGRAFLFSVEDGTAVGRKLALQILTELRGDVRPRLVVHSQLMTVLRGA